MSINHARRRLAVAIAAGCASLTTFRSSASRAANELIEGNTDALSHWAAAVTAGATIRTGRGTIDTPCLADNDHSVPITVNAECAAAPQEFVRRIVRVTYSNPHPMIATFHLNTKSGRAEMGAGMSANPSVQFYFVANRTGDLELNGIGHAGERGSHRARVQGVT